MARKFNVPQFYRSSAIGRIKQVRLQADPRKKDLSPTVLELGALRLKIARHFGFCFGVENAIEIAYRAVEENTGKRIYLLSEMIHNPQVNADLVARGVKFLMDTGGNRLISFDELTPEDIVIVPAFGTTLELQRELAHRGIDPYFYDATCPFVEKVWKRSAELGAKDFSVIVHGKRTHEETRATFSHSKETAPTIVVLDMKETELLIDFMNGRLSDAEFYQIFGKSISEGFDPHQHLRRIGVVNQTTMLASDTHAIAERFRETMKSLYGEDKLSEHFADTRDTLCYATYENQSATKELIASGADLAIVVGGYNSSNTSHLVELCEQQMPTYYIRDAEELLSPETIQHFDLHSRQVRSTSGWLPSSRSSPETPLTVAITSGASCPDQTVDQVITRLLKFLGVEFCSVELGSGSLETALGTFEEQLLSTARNQLLSNA